MSTRGMIGALNANGSIRYIFCRYDAYPSGVGKMLLRFYATPERVKALLDLGDVRSLCPRLSNEEPGECPTCGHTSEVSTFFGRDYEDKKATARNTTNIEDLLKHDFAYLFRDGQWFGARAYGDDRTWQPLSEFIANWENGDDDE